MKLGTITWYGGTSAAAIDTDGARPLRTLASRGDAVDVRAVIESPLTADEVEQLRATVPVADYDLLPPVLHPSKNILCVGKNYVEHAREGAKALGRPDQPLPTSPIWFSKPATAIIGPGQPIRHDPSFTSALDYEGELALVVGRVAKSVTPEDALGVVFGYTIVNDVTARDVQQGRTQWFLGKSADTFAPCGPWVVTADDIPDPRALRVRTLVNGDVRQDASVADLIFDIPTLIADISKSVTLQPGDIIATGTPAGVAWGMDEPKYLGDGDVVRVEIDGIGSLENPVTAV